MMGTIQSNDENRASVWVKVTVTKPVWSKGKGLRQVFRTINLTE
jgi:hypothetical protein